MWQLKKGFTTSVNNDKDDIDQVKARSDFQT